MIEENRAERMERLRREEDAAQARRESARQEWARRRNEFRAALLGSADPLAQQKPPAIDDFDALLRVEAAQLRNAVDYLMGEVLSDEATREDRRLAIASLTRMIQANVVIARTVGAMAGESKTVRGGGAPGRAPD
ncbi:MAG TPA: hypothetical protein VGB91_15965 [Rhizomicrobium sp.]